VADRFAFGFRNDPRVLVPRMVWARTTRRVLTMEYVEGWRLSELDEARLAGVDTRGLAVHGANVFMRQVLVTGRYHADLHPANLLVTRDNRIAYLDFGIVGALSQRERALVAQMLAALVFRDARRALLASAELGVVVPPEKEDTVRRGLGALMDRTLAVEDSRKSPPLAGPVGARADVRDFGMGFLSLLGRNDIEIPVGYGLLVKSLVTVEGVSRALYPEIDIIEATRPFVTRLLAREALRPGRLYARLPAAAWAALRELSA
jgi:ubiquinone biosynthesis protein